MAILEKLFILFLFTFPTGVIARVQLTNGVAFTLNDIILAILVLTWVILKLKHKKLKANYFLQKPLLLFVLIGIVSLMLNLTKLEIGNFLVAASYLIRFIAYSLIYFIVRDFSDTFKTNINKYFILSGALVLLVGYFQFFFFPSLKPIFNLGWDEHLYRMTSSFLDPNFAGAFFVFYLIICLDFLRINMSKFSRAKSLIFAVVPALSLIAVYLTYSRSALIMLFASIITYLILINKKKWSGVIIGILILMILISPKAFKTEGTNLLRIVSTTERISSAQIAIKVISDNPLFGVGFNAYRYAQTKYGLEGIYWQVTHSGAGTDSSLLFVLATTGVFGFISYIYLIYKILKLATVNKSKYGFVLLVSMVGLLFNSLFINSLFYVFILELIFIQCGLTESS